MSGGSYGERVYRPRHTGAGGAGRGPNASGHVHLTLKKDGSCEVTDNGRGIPVDIHPKLGVSAVEVVYTQLHAGGKFNDKNYAYSGGLHGVGASVVNALSEWVTVDVYKDYSHYAVRFESITDPKTHKIISGHTVRPLEKVGNTRKRGTQVCFMPDKRVFEDVRFNGESPTATSTSACRRCTRWRRGTRPSTATRAGFRTSCAF